MANVLLWVGILIMTLVLGWWLWQLRRIPATVCGHRTQVRGLLQAFGESRSMKLPVSANGTTEYCHTCLQAMTIQCWHCGQPIFVGDPVTLHGLADPKRPMPDYARYYQSEAGIEDERAGRPIGCMREECHDYGIEDRSGFLGMNGRVQRVPTPNEVIWAERAARQESTIVDYTKT
jgi:hypothetical protein